MLQESSNQAVETPTTEANPAQVEGKTEETKTESKPDISAARFAALAKQEKKIQEEKAALKAAQEQVAKVNSLKENIKQNPAALLEEFGITLDDLVLATLGSIEDKNEDPLESLKKEIEELKTSKQKEIEESQRQKQEAEAKQIEETINKHKQSYRQFIESNADKYELIQLNDAYETVWEVVEAHYDATGEALTPEQAASKVEAYYENEAKKLLSAKKLAQNVPQAKVEQEQKEEKISSKTLTSNLVEKAGSVKKEYINHSSEDERKQRIIAAAKNLWK